MRARDLGEVGLHREVPVAAARAVGQFKRLPGGVDHVRPRALVLCLGAWPRHRLDAVGDQVAAAAHLALFELGIGTARTLQAFSRSMFFGISWWRGPGPAGV